MTAAVDELEVERIDPIGGALRLGVLYDLLGRTVDEDARAATVERFIDRYRIDREQASRVSELAVALYRRAATAAGSDGRAAAGLGGAAARGRDVGFAHRVSQARCVHPAERGHAGLLRRRAGPPGAASSTAAAAGSRRSRAPSPTRRSARPSSRCGSPCCSTTRARRSRRRAFSSRSESGSRSRSRGAGSPRIR